MWLMTPHSSPGSELLLTDPSYRLFYDQMVWRGCKIKFHCHHALEHLTTVMEKSNRCGFSKGNTASLTFFESLDKWQRRVELIVIPYLEFFQVISKSPLKTVKEDSHRQKLVRFLPPFSVQMSSGLVPHQRHTVCCPKLSNSISLHACPSRSLDLAANIPLTFLCCC